ncbi:hypothetical protein YPPY52_0646, partial [Yersinia pestis PY-52]
MPAEDRKNGSR